MYVRNIYSLFTFLKYTRYNANTCIRIYTWIQSSEKSIAPWNTLENLSNQWNILTYLQYQTLGRLHSCKFLDYADEKIPRTFKHYNNNKKSPQHSRTRINPQSHPRTSLSPASRGANSIRKSQVHASQINTRKKKRPQIPRPNQARAAPRRMPSH